MDPILDINHSFINMASIEKIELLYQRAMFVSNFITYHNDVASNLDIGSDIGKTAPHFKNHKHLEVVNFTDKDYNLLERRRYRYMPAISEAI